MSFPDFFGKCEIISYCICGSGFLPQAATKIVIFLESLCNLNKFLQKSARFSFFLAKIMPNPCNFGEF